jgi:hypothetical protein
VVQWLWIFFLFPLRSIEEDMKKVFASLKDDCKEISVSGVRKFVAKQKQKLKSGQLKCPLCKEMFTGMSELLAHVKDHCT